MNIRTVLEMIRGALPLILSAMIAHDNTGKRRTFFGLLSSSMKTHEKIKTKEKDRRAEKNGKETTSKEEDDNRQNEYRQILDINRWQLHVLMICHAGSRPCGRQAIRLDAQHAPRGYHHVSCVGSRRLPHPKGQCQPP